MYGLILSLLVVTSEPATLNPDGTAQVPFCTQADEAACKAECESLVKPGEELVASKCKRKVILFLGMDIPWPKVLADCGCQIEPKQTARAKVERPKTN